jgi:hypothetical protein
MYEALLKSTGMPPFIFHDGLQQPVGHTEVDSQRENNLYSVVQIAVVGQIASIRIVPHAAPPRTG